MLRQNFLKFAAQKENSYFFDKDYKKFAEKEAFNDEDRQELFEKLRDHLERDLWRDSIVKYFPQFFPIILSMAVPLDPSESCKNTETTHSHKKKCILLSKLLPLHPDVLGHTIRYFERYPSPFEPLPIPDPAEKRTKLEVPPQEKEPTDEKIVIATLNILISARSHFKEKWDWSKFYVYLNHKVKKVQFIAIKCMSIVLNMSEKQTMSLIKSSISAFDIHNWTTDRYIESSSSSPIIEDYDVNDFDDSTKNCRSLISVAGVLLPVLNTHCQGTLNLIPVPSMELNLRSLALAVASRKAVCLQGPVGCGKTAIVEYLAKITGRGPKDMIKVQLGDQTDSKTLLGTYRCTDIPGEFIWQPGVLTQAVLSGKWLLLEDIDSAGLDVASILSSLIETGTLSVPGYRDKIYAGSEFQLFLTQRLITTMSGQYRQGSGASSLLEKHWQCVHMDPLSKNELITIVQTLFPALSTIAMRIIDVFLLFSSGNHKTEVNENLSLKTGRLISVRDLMKWCTRAIIDFDVSSPDSALKVMQDAIDIFCCSVSIQELRLDLAISVANTLGIIKTKAEYFVNTHKPSVSINLESFSAGRAKVSRKNTRLVKLNGNTNYSFTRPSASLLERITCCVAQKEPVLLVGETGTGKTSTIQFLAKSTGNKLIVINMNQQSESADLIGGYKPADIKLIVTPIREEFEILFRSYYAIEPNRKFLEHIAGCYREKKWKTLVTLMAHSATAAVQKLSNQKDQVSSSERGKRPRKSSKERKNSATSKEQLIKWEKLLLKLEKLKAQVKTEFSLAFAFIEGSLIKALQEGHWVLLDEINLASSETLECLSGLLEGSTGSLSLLERGDNEAVKRHQDFTMFACMNPATDIGKKELPVGLRNRFTEFYVDELTEPIDLQLLVNSYLSNLCLTSNKVESIVKFYLTVRKEAMNSLSDGTGHKPHFSLRTLCRALSVAVQNPCGNVLRSLYEAFCLSFLTQLDQNSYTLVQKLIAQIILDKSSVKATLGTPIPKPKCSTDEDYINFEDYWVIKGILDPEIPNNYILTSSVRRNLKNLVRVVSIGKMPVLLQGDTSVGKTSLITYLAKSSGHVCVRINNHEHTDLQEYIGSYVASETGKLVFKEGALVEAMRKGYWIILDELNLAPSDVLEALNRVLDDNRELFIPETQDTVKAHSNFMLFATQNPPGIYGGRKVLSRAFRNRFVELHFDEIPSIELQLILHERCHMPDSYCRQIINVMTDLQMRRKSTAAFSGKQGFITLRDLFRWGERYRLALDVGEKLYDWSQHLADEGYLVLAAKVRKSEEAEEIRQVIKKHLKRDVDPSKLFTLNENTSSVTKSILEAILNEPIEGFEHIVWTYHMRRMAVLVAKSCQFNEPILLVGETGGGKTTVCQLAAAMKKKKLLSVNCHMHTESSDFLGNLRPVREHSDVDNQKLFEWIDGPLITAMRTGDIFLADEISLADDSVLERMNSLLEPERSILLAEKSTDSNINSNELESVIIAHKDFCFIGTMNPGGDYGKKELSPALRNRFTEIWCEGCTNNDDLRVIIQHNLHLQAKTENQTIAEAMLDFLNWLKLSEVGRKFSISIRDVLTWVNFMNSCNNSLTKLNISEAYLHGAYLTYIDSLGSGVTGTESNEKLELFRKSAIKFLKDQVERNFKELDKKFLNTELDVVTDEIYGVPPFFIPAGPKGKSDNVNFTFTAPTTKSNTLKVLRALQLKKPLLLEGSPGVGKTSLVSAIAKASGNSVLRINLSDQTDVSDLFGADLPLEGGKGGKFAWKDGPLLRALKSGDWILLDELNLASQSVLEGLNACLDHRGEIYIPELDKTFYVGSGTKLFGCQNPLRQGGARHGLPKSFLNRFTQVYVDALSDDDLRIIIQSQFPELNGKLIDNMVEFNSRLSAEAGISWGYSGAPWDMNLRDITRLCELISASEGEMEEKKRLIAAIELIYIERMRTVGDKEQVRRIFADVFERDETSISEFIQPTMYITDDYLYFDSVKVKRTNKSYCTDDNLLVLREQMPVLKQLAYCVNMNWMPILVGASGSGKSSVVRVLAQLTGQKLRSITVNSAMDTTEILGGFEQADYNRHLEQLIYDTEDLLITLIKDNLQSNEVQKFAELHQQLERVKAPTYDERLSRTVTAELDLFLQRIQELLKLTSTMKSLESSLNTAELTKIEDKLEKLSALVKEDKCLNAGGKFEWIDSILVKCLQDGTWLLVDQVNLCSPAVLDRLNGLLEPNGVLTIGERGTDASGNVHTIKPNPNFRLFLTMDPRYGEMSRAMRNRGVEIYLLGCNETSSINELDVKSQLTNLGLTRVNHQSALLDIHRKLSDDNFVSEKLSIIQLLHAAFLITQQINHGFPTVNAFKIACTDVYIKSRYIQEPTMKKKLLSIIDETMTTHQLTVDVESYLNLPEITPNIHDLLNNSNESLMKQQLAIGEAMCTAYDEYWQDSHSDELQTDFLNKILDPEGLNQNFVSDDVDNVYLHFLMNFMEKSSIDHMEARIEFIQKRHRHSILGSCEWLWKGLKELHQLIQKKAEELPNSSLPWHPLTSPSHFTQKQQDLALRISLISYVKITNAEADINQFLERGEHRVSVEDFSRAVLDDRVPERECSVLIVLFTPVAEEITKWINTYIIDICENLNYTDFISLRCKLLWTKRFYEQGKTILYHMGKDEDDDEAKRRSDIERSLRVHYQWMMKFINTTIEESSIIDRSDRTDIEEMRKIKNNLQTLLREVNLNLHSDDDGFRKLTRIIKKFMQLREPFKSMEIIDNYNKLDVIIDQFLPIDINIKSEIAWKLKLMIMQLDESLELRERLIKALQFTEINQVNIDDDIITSAEKYFDQYKLTLRTPEEIEQALENILTIKTDKDLNDSSLNIQLWPIYEFLFILLTNKLHKNVSDMVLSHETSRITCNELSKFSKIPSIPIKLIAIFNELIVNGFNESIVSDLFCRLRDFRNNSLVLKSTNAVLNFTGVNHEDADKISPKNINENDLNEPFNSLLQPNLIILLSNLILNFENRYNDNSTIKLANLINCSGKTDQLKTINDILWKNSISFNSKTFEFYYNDSKLLFNYIMNYIESIDNAGDEESFRTIICSPQLNLLPIMFKYEREFSQPLKALKKFTEKLKNTPESISGIDVGLTWVGLGAHQMFLLTNLELIDPVEKVDLKIDYIEEDIKDLKNMIYAISLDAHVLGDHTIAKRDPRIIETRKFLENLYEKRDKLIKSKGFRSSDSNYFELLQVIDVFRETIGETLVQLTEPASSLHRIISNEINEPNRIVNEFVNSANAAIETTKLCERSLHQFYLRLEKNFLVNYRELVQPILTSLAYILHGTKILIDETTYLIGVRETSFDLSSTAQSFLFNLVRFPTIGNKQDNLLQLIDLCTCSSTREFIESQINSRNPADSLIEQFRILKNAISELYNHTSLIGNLTPQLWDELNRLLQQIVLIWQKKEAEKQREMQDEESLYKNKARVMAENITEEEEIDAELRKLFPTHRTDDFHEIDTIEKQQSLDAVPERSEIQDQSSSINYRDLITEEDVRYIYEMHSKIVKHFIPAHWIQPINDQDHPKRNYIDPWLERFQTFSKLLHQVQPALSSDLSTELHMSFNILTSLAAATNQGISFIPETSNEKSYDFYKSQNIKEIKQCLPILEAILNRVNDLLKEWPGHPTLSWIRIIIKRIHNFPIISPISRFLTGLELLLVKMKEWEENAHSGVSLGDHSALLTQKIIDWRKLELNCWKNCLNSAFERLKDKTSRWWFFIYAMIESYFNDSQSNTDDSAGLPEENCVTGKQLIERLEDFITLSPLVEFQARLDLLSTFHAHVFHAKSGVKKDELLAILWNIYNYYSQFSKDVQNKINSLKIPIEKKLKDFVKIARWNDINYWSVKETVEKTHRTLHKFIREYENSLKQSVSSFLVVEPSDYDSVLCKDDSNRSEGHYSIDPSDFVTSLTVNHQIFVQNELLARSSHLLKKAKKLCRETILHSIYPGMRVELEQFIEDTMSNSVRLKNLEVDRTLPKPKQKSFAKSILQQKKMALADYFKTMSSFGISYRKGLLALKHRPDDISDKTVAPLDISASLRRIESLEKADHQMLAVWDGCQAYYYKSLIKLNALNSVMTKFQSDLGISNMERCSGLPNHLMLLAHNQKKTLVDNFNSFLALKRQLSNLSKIDDSSVALPLNDDIVKSSRGLKDLLVSLRINFEQLKIYMQCCPADNDVEKNSDFLMLESSDIPIINATKSDEIWSRALCYLNECSNIIDQQFKNYEKIFSESSVLRTSIHYNYLSKSSEKLDKIKLLISKLLEVFSLNHPIIMSFNYLLSKIERWSNNFRRLELFSSTTIDTKDKSLIDFSDKTEFLIKTFLLVIQDKYKEASFIENDELPNAEMEEDKKEDDTIEDEEISQLHSNGLREKLIESLEKDIKNLKLHEIVKKLEELLKLSQKINPSFLLQSNLILRTCTPILNQYILFSQFYLNEQVALFRTTCKLLYLQLNVFFDLVKNGFCIPKDLDLDAEADNDGIQQDSDKGGMGLSNEEGKKDVSDRIESEDQLDDTRQADKNEEKEEDKDCKEEDNGIEMSENFDSKLQDLDKKEEDELGNEENEDEKLDKEMGETEEGGDQLDREIWGDDEEEEVDESKETEEQGQGEETGEKEMTAKDEKTKKNSGNDDEDQNMNREDAEEEKEEINEMEESDVNDDQINPYHGNQEPQQEPEPMDLSDDFNLDEDEAKEGNTEDKEDPFDIDGMKECMPPPEEKEPEKSEEKKNTEEADDSSDEEDNEETSADPQVKDLDAEELEKPEESSNQGSGDNDKNEEENQPENDESGEKEKEAAPSANDPSDETLEAEELEAKRDGSHDKVQNEGNQNDGQDNPVADNNQEDGNDKGTGQAQSEEQDHGHVGNSADQNTPMDLQKIEKRKPEKRKNPGESNEDRALVDNVKPDTKKQRMIHSREDSSKDEANEGAEEEKDGYSDMCEHVKESEKYDNYATDAATEEQAKKQTIDTENDEADTPLDAEMHEDEIVEEDAVESSVQDAEKTEKLNENEKKSKTSSKGQHLEDSHMETKTDVDGETTETMKLQRAAESAFYTNLMDQPDSTIKIEEKRREIETMLSQWTCMPTTEEALVAWNGLCAVTESSARDLSEKLRLVLEPTRATRLKGDYRTGKRINMRKIIPYIASQFRKDKIWLRRTKPSKRDYQIVLALDDSSSMADNHSKELAFESLSLISKAMGYLEAGQLSVMSFGESPKILHPLGEPFTEQSGSRLIQEMKFDQKKTMIGELVNFTVEMFENQKTSNDNAKLLVVLSDGRGIFSEGIDRVNQAVRRAKLLDIFLVFIIVENPVNKDSILDIRMPIFENGKLLGIRQYMDSFPFPFYIILRDINALPNVLSDALRQWFEVVGKVDT